MSEHTPPPCVDDRQLTRPRYFDGQVLTARDFLSEQSYTLDRLRAHNRLLHGYGTICGLEVEPTEPPSTSIVVQPGIALDCCGREIVVIEPVAVDLSAAVEASRRSRAVFVSVAYREIEVEPAPAPAGLPGGDQATAIREVADITISTDRPAEAAGTGAVGGVRPCPPCHDPRVLLATVGVRGTRPVTAAAIDIAARPIVATPVALVDREPTLRPKRRSRLLRRAAALGLVGWTLLRLCRARGGSRAR